MEHIGRRRERRRTNADLFFERTPSCFGKVDSPLPPPMAKWMVTDFSNNV
jgi:hypothetical protein